MPKGSRANKKTPDSGYKFDCQYCEGETFQAQQPELVIAIEEAGSGKSRSLQSVCYQACVECAIEIKDNNQKHLKKIKVKQVRPLRDATELDSLIPEKPIATASTSDAKLDKVLDAIAALTQLMTMQIESQMPKPVISRDTFIKEMEPVLTKTYKVPPAKKAPIPKAKRAILAPPVKKNASKTKKPTSVKTAPAKPKPRSKR